MDPRWTDEDYCLEYLKGLRWPGGVPCPRCQAITPHRKLPGQRQYACSRCGKQESVTAGTLMHRTNALGPWSQAAWLLTRPGERVSIRSVAISPDISLDMALRVCHRIGGVIESLDLEALPVTWASVMRGAFLRSPMANQSPLGPWPPTLRLPRQTCYPRPRRSWTLRCGQSGTRRPR